MIIQSVAEYKSVPISEVSLDLKNPRIARALDMYGSEPTAEQIALALGAGDPSKEQGGPSFASLKQSIRSNGSVIHPIIVSRDKSGHMVVIEGNTRTLIYREFHERGEKGNWDSIPAIIYDNLDIAQIDSIRLQAHMVGVRQWDPYSKAKYLHHLRNEEHLTWDQIVDFCGGNKRDIQNYIDAYIDMEKYYRAVIDSDADFDHTRFSAFAELQKKPEINRALVEAGYSKEDFSRWVHERKIAPLDKVRQIPRVFRNKAALDKFMKDDIVEAIKILDSPISDQCVKEKVTFESQCNQLVRRVNDLSYPEFVKLQQDPECDTVYAIKDALETLASLYKNITGEDSNV